MLSRMLHGAVVLAVICTPAMAQTMTLAKGQMLKVGPDGQVTIGAMPTDAKMVRAMHRRGKAMSGGFVAWMNEQGQIYMSNQEIFFRGNGL